jgi:hypothetical protein
MIASGEQAARARAIKTAAKYLQIRMRHSMRMRRGEWALWGRMAHHNQALIASRNVPGASIERIREYDAPSQFR